MITSLEEGTMKKMLLSVVMGCAGPAGTDIDKIVDDPTDQVPTDGETGDTETPEPTGECDSGVNVDVFRVRELPNQPLGRALEIEMDGDANAVVSCALDAAPPAWVQLVPLQAEWKYLSSGVDPGAGWADPGFDDGTWAVGPAPFAAPDAGATRLAEGGAEPPTTIWFRTTFEVDDPSRISELRAAIRADDGVVVHINGQEAVRRNVPATEPMYGDDEMVLKGHGIPVTPGMLVQGTNTIAVELHQYEGSADASFHLRLTGLEAQDPSGEILLVESEEPAASHTLGLYGLLPGATYVCRAHSDTECGGTIEQTVEVAPLAGAYPSLALHPEHHTTSWGSYTLLNHQRPCAEDHTNRLVIVDAEGQPRWIYEIDMSAGSTIDIESTLVGNDRVLWSGGQQPESHPQIVTLDGEVEYFATYPGSEADIYHHDVERDEDGLLLGITESSVRGETHSWMGWGMVEHDPATGQVTWRWESRDAFARGELSPAAEGDYDPWHPNSFTSVSDADGDGVEVGLLYSNEIVRVDRATGQVQWHLGPTGEFELVAPNGSPLPADQWFDHIHGLNRYGDLLYMYDNGWTDQQSRAMALRLDTANRKATLAWQWTEYGWYEKHWGDVDELPSGDVLVTMARSCSRNSDHPGALVEVDPDTNDVTWRLDFLDPDDSTYRAEKLDGCAIFANSRYCPSVAERLEQVRR